jgi:hypothetical protein
MEWQANGIAPRILMPIQTVKSVFVQLCDKYDYFRSGNVELNINDLNRLFNFQQANFMDKIEWVRDKLADFYQVSKWSAGIRLVKLGLIAPIIHTTDVPLFERVGGNKHSPCISIQFFVFIGFLVVDIGKTVSKTHLPENAEIFGQACLNGIESHFVLGNILNRYRHRGFQGIRVVFCEKFSRGIVEVPFSDTGDKNSCLT